MYEDDSSYGTDVLFPEARIDVGDDSFIWVETDIEALT